MAHGLSCSTACRIFPGQGSNPCPLHWQADSSLLCHQGSPNPKFSWPISSIWSGWSPPPPRRGFWDPHSRSAFSVSSSSLLGPLCWVLLLPPASPCRIPQASGFGLLVIFIYTFPLGGLIQCHDCKCHLYAVLLTWPLG